MNHRTAVPLLRTAQAAWESESRLETYLAVALGLAGVFLLVREAWRLRSIWSNN